MTCPALLRFRKVLYFGLTPQEVSFVTSASVGHRVEIHMPSDILNAYFSWSRPSGSTKPVANFLSNESSLLQTSLDSLPSFARTLENYLGSVYTDLDPRDGLDFSSSSLDHLGDINRDECIYNKLTDIGLANQEPASGESSTHYSANDLAMAHMLYKCFGSSSYNTDDVYNIDDAFGMITSKELADKITEMLSADQAGGANMINSMFNHLLSSEPLRYVGNETTASALFSNSPSPQDVSGSWGFVRGDKLEFTLRLMYRAPVTTVDSDGNESAPYVVGQAHDYTYSPPSGPSNPAPNPANVINIRLQITCDAPQGSSAPTAPSAPRSVSAVPGNGQATVSWTPPADSGGSAITSYTVTSSPGGFTATGASSPLVVSGLTNGTSYTFRVVASNSIGNSPGSSSSSVTILGAGGGGGGGGGNQATVPRAPRSVSATVGNGQASVSFSAPLSDGGSSITSYTVTSSPGGFTASGASSPLLVTGLSNGTAYTFSVVATNSIGNSQGSSSSAVTPATVPDAPTSVSGMFGDNQALVSWSAPANDGGSAITSYTVTSFPGGFTGSASSSPATVSGLSNGTAYTFTVVATNSIGDSQASSASDPVTPSSAPDAPTAVSATAGNGEATVSWTAPFDEGAAITSYTVISSPGGFTASSATTSATVTGLTNGTAYTFTVYATNMDGNSGVSLPSDPVTPATVPDAPTNLSAVSGDAHADITWTEPSNNGSIITSYIVTSSPGGFTASSSNTSVILSGLTNGTSYTFTVIATNAIGNSAPSSVSSAITPNIVYAGPKVMLQATNYSGSGAWHDQTGNYFDATLEVGTAAKNADGNGIVFDGSTRWGLPNLNLGNATTHNIWYKMNSFLDLDGMGVYLIAQDLLYSSYEASPGTIHIFLNTDYGARTTEYITSADYYKYYSGIGNNDNRVTVMNDHSWLNIQVTWDGQYIKYYKNGVLAFTTYTQGDTIFDFGKTYHIGGPIPYEQEGTAFLGGYLIGEIGEITIYDYAISSQQALDNYNNSAANYAVDTNISKVPRPPTNISATAGNTQATVRWIAPTNHGSSSITSYTVTSSPGGITASSATSPVTVTGLTNGVAYKFTVVATNSVGNSTSSLQSSSVIPTIAPPNPPTNVSASFGTRADVSWLAPTNNNGASILSYRVTSSPGGITATSTSSPVTVAGLTNGIAYTFTVVAINDVGESPASLPSTTGTAQYLWNNSGVVSTFVGNYTNNQRANGNGTNARLRGPNGIVRTNDGNMYISDIGVIVKVTNDGTVSRLAGLEEYTTSYFIDGIGDNVRFSNIAAICTDNMGNLYVTDNNAVRKVVISTQEVITLVGGGFNDIDGICYANNCLYIIDNTRSDSGARICKLDLSTNFVTQIPWQIMLSGISSISYDGNGNLYIQNLHRIYKVVLSNGEFVNTTLIAGGGTIKTAISAESNENFHIPRGGKVAPDGNFYVCDFLNNSIRKITPSGIVTTIAGGGASGSESGHTNGTGTNALFNNPSDLTFDLSGNIYVADTNNYIIRKIS